MRRGKVKSSKKRGHGGSLSVGLDGTAVAMPVEAGPEFEIYKERGEDAEWGASDGFVFAYRVSRIKLKRRTGEVKEEEYTKGGALYGLKESLNRDADQEEGVRFEMDDIEGDDAVAREFSEEELINAADDYEECICINPQDFDD